MADDVVRFPKGGFRPLTEAVLDTVIEGTVADLLMASAASRSCLKVLKVSEHGRTWW